MRARIALAVAAMLGGVAISPAAADFPKKAPRASLVQVLAGAKQALLLDRSTGDYQVVKVGDAVQGFRVSEIEEDQIVLASPLPPEYYFVLPLVGAPVGGSAVGPAASVPPAGATAAAPQGAGGPPPEGELQLGIPATPEEADVLDPYGGGLAGGSSVLDPYGAPSPSAQPGGIPSVIAPPASRVSPAPEPASGAGSVPGSASAPGPAQPVAPSPSVGADLNVGIEAGIGAGATAGATADPNRVAPDSAPDTKVTTVKPTEVRPGASMSATPAAGPAQPAEQARKLSRRDLDGALADFSALAKQMRIERAAGGGVRILDLERGSFVAQLGLERGDVVKRVAGLPIDTVDKAAAAYAAIASAKEVLVDLDRRGASVRIRYQLTR